MSNDMVLTITTKDKYKYQVKESIFTNTSEQLWEIRFQENEKYFVLLNPSIGKVLTAHEDMLKIKGMYASLYNAHFLTFPACF
jgi:hypothetical protein